MVYTITTFRKVVLINFLFCSIVACQSMSQQTTTKSPTSRQTAEGKPTSRSPRRELHNPPRLEGSAQAARESVRGFLAWAGASTLEEEEDGRRVIQRAQSNDEIAKGLIQEFHTAQQRDFSRALLILSVIGEQKNPIGEQFLFELVRQPLPEKGVTTGEGELVEQSAAAMLQAKAIDGLAYMKIEKWDQVVLELSGKHPSRIVRAEAINAYLWNHGDSANAREQLTRYVRPDERIFLDRVRRERGEHADSFNRKLSLFMKAHPEARPPAPRHVQNRNKPKELTDPPAF